MLGAALNVLHAGFGGGERAGRLADVLDAPVDFHGILVGRRVADSGTFAPLMRRPASPSTAQVPKKRPCTESCSSRYFMYSGVIDELMCLRTNDSRSTAMRTTWRPMLPKPLAPSLIGASAPSGWARPRACSPARRARRGISSGIGKPLARGVRALARGEGEGEGIKEGEGVARRGGRAVGGGLSGGLSCARAFAGAAYRTGRRRVRHEVAEVGVVSLHQVMLPLSLVRYRLC